MDEELFGQRDDDGKLKYDAQGKIIRKVIGADPKYPDRTIDKEKEYRRFVNHTPSELYPQGFNKIKVVDQMSREEINAKYPGLLASGNFAYINPQYFHARKMKLGDKIEVTSRI